MRRIVILAALSIIPVACAAPGASTADSPTTDTAATLARVQRLETEARALVKADGCGTTNQCRTAPVGSRPCGGPRDYVVYCAATTDSASLYRKLDELKVAEEAYNKAAGLASTCEFRTPPNVSSQGGSCRAVP